jgi:nicotinamidase-related amidase
VRRVTLPTWHYQQFDADLSRPVPGEGYGGWKRSDLPLAPDRTALAVMHAWDTGTPEAYPGWYRAVEYLPRAQRILREVFPALLAGARASGLKVYHVVSDRRCVQDHPGYLSTAALLAGARTAATEKADRDEVWNELSRFRESGVFPGAHNQPDIREGFRRIGFPKEAEPAPGESIASDEAELFALCRRDGVNHLVYCGFAINWCLLMSSGGMLDMFRHGVMCSAVRDAVTAVENRESAAAESHKEEALWRTSLMFGFAYDSADLLKALGEAASGLP